MATVVAVTEDRLARTARRSLMGGTEYTRTYHVEFDAEAGPHYCFNAIVSGGGSVQVPDVGHAHPDNGLATVRDISPALQEDSDRHYKVVVRYSSTAEGETPVSDDPLEAPVQFRWWRESEEKEYARSWKLPEVGHALLPPGITVNGDTNQFPVVASNLSPLDPTPTRQYSSDIFGISWNSAEPIPYNMRDAKDVVNELPFSIMRNASGTHGPLMFAPETVLLRGVSAEFVSSGGSHYWATTVEMAYRPYQHEWRYVDQGGHLYNISGWDDLVEAWGLMEFDTQSVSTRKLNQIMIPAPDGSKAEPPGPLPLTRDGRWLQANDETGATQFVHWFRPYERMDFATLGMP